jgi:hypothetical protein
VARSLGRDEGGGQRETESRSPSRPAVPHGRDVTQRVVMELGDPKGRTDEVSDGGMGEDSVWLEFGDPVPMEETTQRQPPPGRGQATADVLADRGAVRVDLSLGRSGAPDLDARRRKPDGDSEWRSASKPTEAGSPPEDLRGLVRATRARSPDLLGQETTDQDGLLEEQVTEGVWEDGF